MKPFDLGFALTGVKKIVNISSEQFDVIKATLFDQEMLLARARNGSTGLQQISETGVMSDGTQLYVVSDKFVRYVNIYPASDGTFISGKVFHDSVEAAREVAGANLLAVARVEFEA